MSSIFLLQHCDTVMLKITLTSPFKFIFLYLMSYVRYPSMSPFLFAGDIYHCKEFLPCLRLFYCQVDGTLFNKLNFWNACSVLPSDGNMSIALSLSLGIESGVENWK